MSAIQWNDGWRWMLVEGVAPLFGAALLYVLVGVALYVVNQKGVPFAFRWLEWLDPLGWLYGVSILAAQAGWKSYFFHEAWHLSWRLTAYCGTIGAVSLLLLIIAMVIRGRTPAFRPPFLLNFVAAVLAAAMLYVGYTVFAAAPKGDCPCPRPAQIPTRISPQAMP